MAEGKFDDKSSVAQLQGQIDQLKSALAEVASANVLPGVLQCGFEQVIAQLKPLRDLTPPRESVERPIAEAAAAMLHAMEGVTLKGDSLQIPMVNVPFIGEALDPYRTPDQTIQQQHLRGGYRP